MAFEEVPRGASGEMRAKEVFVLVSTFSHQGIQKSHKGPGPRTRVNPGSETSLVEGSGEETGLLQAFEIHR